MVVVLNDLPLPLSDPVGRRKRVKLYGPRDEDPKEGLLTDVWAEYFANREQVISLTQARVNNVSLAAQAASIGATDMSGGALNAGLYQLQYYTRITQAATTSSSLTITLDWQDGGTAPTYSGAAITGNTTTTTQSGSLLIDAAGLSPVRYSTTYASVGATPMQYKLEIVLTRVQT